VSTREAIAVVDDTEDMRAALRRALERAGYPVAEEARGADALRIAVEPELLRAAVRALRTCDQFLSITSHDIRGLLQALRLTLDVQLLRARDPDFDREAMVRTICRSIADVQQMSKLVDDILDRSRLHEGKLALRPQQTDLAALVGDTVQRFAEEAATSRSPIQLDAQVPVIGGFDPVRVDQIVANLLSNAMKFGAGKPIAVSVHRAGDAARITVSDRGPGIADADRDHVFERFDRGTATDAAGYGLGLWIVRELARLHGGGVTLESTAGRGATFTVTLPLAPR
jgi:signal transduction histidine kinase